MGKQTIGIVLIALAALALLEAHEVFDTVLFTWLTSGCTALFGVAYMVMNQQKPE